MRVLRRIELVAALAAGVLGAAGMGLQLWLGFGMCWDGGYVMYPDGQGICLTDLPNGLGIIGTVFFWVVFLALVATIGGALAHSRRGSRAGLIALVVGAVLFDVTLIPPTPLRILLLPAAVLASIAAVAGWVGAVRRLAAG